MLKAPDIRETLASIVPAVNWQDISDDESLSDAGLDSLDKATLFLKIEEQTGRSIPDDDYESLDSIGEIVKYMSEENQ